MASRPPPRVTWKDWLPVISLIVVLIGAMLSGGGYIEKLNDALRRVAVLEVKSDGRDDKLNVINERTARIEAKLEVLTAPVEKVQPR